MGAELTALTFVCLALLCLFLLWFFGFINPQASFKQKQLPKSLPPQPPAQRSTVLQERKRTTPYARPAVASSPRSKQARTRLPSRKHLRNVREGDRVLQRLRVQVAAAGNKLPIVIGTLRRISSYIFEELLLNAALDQGWEIQRNFRYSGDGGVDGRVLIAGELYVVQAKRYSGHIKPEHIRDFHRVILRKGAASGLFIHTGKTGLLAKRSLHEADVILISGQRLVDFILGHSLAITAGRRG